MENKEEEKKVGGKGWLTIVIVWTITWVLVSLLLGFVQQLFFAGLVILVGLVVGVWIFINFTIPMFFAPRDLSWAFVNESEAILVFHGAKYDKTLMNYEGFYLDHDFIIRLPDGFKPPDKKEEKKKYVEKYFKDNGLPSQPKQGFLGGIKWIGFPPSLHEVAIIHQSWKAFRENEVGKMKTYDEFLRGIKLFLDQYVFDYKKSPGEAIEDIHRVPIVGARIVTPARVYCPRSSMLSTKNWVESTGATLWPILENMIACFSWEELTVMRANKGKVAVHKKRKIIFGKEIKEGEDLNELFWSLFKGAVDSVATYIPKNEIPNEKEECFSVFGMIFYKEGFKVYKIDPDQKFRDDANKRYEEEKAREAALIKADSDKKVKVIKAKAEAEALEIEGDAVQANLLSRTSGFAIKAIAGTLDIPEEEVSKRLREGELKEEFKDFLKQGLDRETSDNDQYYPSDASIASFIRMMFGQKK